MRGPCSGTFKLNRQELAREGYDPAVVNDVLYFNDRRTQLYVRLDMALNASIQSGGYYAGTLN
jgi:hypothetical protein